MLSLSGERWLLLGITKEQRTNFAIAFLESNGYIVKKDYSKLVGKRAAFRQEGMKPILHGKVINVSINGCCTIRCKNGCMRYTNVNDVIKFCDEKELCYIIKNNR